MLLQAFRTGQCFFLPPIAPASQQLGDDQYFPRLNCQNRQLAIVRNEKPRFNRFNAVAPLLCCACVASHKILFWPIKASSKRTKLEITAPCVVAECNSLIIDKARKRKHVQTDNSNKKKICAHLPSIKLSSNASSIKMNTTALHWSQCPMFGHFFSKLFSYSSKSPMKQLQKCKIVRIVR